MTASALSLLIPFAVGVLLLHRAGLTLRSEPLPRSGQAWLIGTLAIGAGVVLSDLSGLGPSQWVWCAPLAGLVLGLTAIEIFSVRTGPQPSAIRSLGAPFTCFLLLLLCLCALRFVAAGATPTIDTDEASIWTMKAKVQFLYPMRSDAYGERMEDVLHADYPLLNPLLHAWSYALSGGIEFFASRRPVQLYFVAALLILAGALRRLVPAWLNGLLLLLLATDAVFLKYSLLGHADVMVGVGWLLAFDAWIRWREDRSRGWALLGGCGAAIALWSKNEALLHVAVIGGVLVALRACARLGGRRSMQAPADFAARGAWIAPAACIVLFGAVVNWALDLENDLVEAGGSSLLALFFAQLTERAPVVLEYAWRELFASPTLAGLLALPLVALLLPWTWWRREPLRLPTLALCGALAGLFAVYIGSLHELEWHLDTSLRRVLFQLGPAACLWFGLFASREEPRS